MRTVKRHSQNFQDRREEEGAREADAIGDGPAEEAEEAHQAEDQGVGGVDEEGLLGAACAEGVHCVPEAGGHEAWLVLGGLLMR